MSICIVTILCEYVPLDYGMLNRGSKSSVNYVSTNFMAIIRLKTSMLYNFSLDMPNDEHEFTETLVGIHLLGYFINDKNNIQIFYAEYTCEWSFEYTRDFCDRY